MATDFGSDNIILLTIASVEEQINTYFETVFEKVAERRDQLLLKIHDMKMDYLKREENRMKQVKELEKIIAKMDELSIQNNVVLQLQEGNLNKVQDELELSKQLILIPVPVFKADELRPLVKLLDKLGSITTDNIYAAQKNPFKNFGGEKKGELGLPLGICHGEKKVYVTDYWNGCIQAYNFEGDALENFGNGILKKPHGIDIDDQNIFVCDWDLNAVFKFRIHDNELVGRSTDELNHPKGLTVDPTFNNERVLITDFHNHQVVVLNSDLKIIKKFGKGELKYPCDVKTHQNKYFVADNGKHNVHIFSKSGELLRNMVSLKGVKLGIFMCLDQFGNIILSESESRTIRFYTQHEDLLYSVKYDGSPQGIVVTKDNTILCAMSKLPFSFKFD